MDPTTYLLFAIQTVGYLYLRAPWMFHFMSYGDAAVVVERHQRLHDVV